MPLSSVDWIIAMPSLYSITPSSMAEKAPSSSAYPNLSASESPAGKRSSSSLATIAQSPSVTTTTPSIATS